MDYQDYITVAAERKKGQHLGMVERGAIKALKQQGLGIRAIAREVGCAPSTITNELRCGIRGSSPPRPDQNGGQRPLLHPGGQPEVLDLWHLPQTLCRCPSPDRNLSGQHGSPRQGTQLSERCLYRLLGQRPPVHPRSPTSPDGRHRPERGLDDPAAGLGGGAAGYECLLDKAQDPAINLFSHHHAPPRPAPPRLGKAMAGKERFQCFLL